MNIVRPNSDIATIEWQAVPKGTYWSTVDDVTISDADYVSRPLTNGAGATPLIFGLETPITLIGLCYINVRAKSTTGANEKVFVTLLDANNLDVSTSNYFTITSTNFVNYRIPVTTTAIASRIKFSAGNLVDPHWGKVVLLARAEGAHGSTTFIDSSTYKRAMNVTVGNPIVSTTNKKFGNSSIYGGPYSSYSMIESSFGPEGTEAQEYTIECWYNRNGTTGNYYGICWTGENAMNLMLRCPNNSGNYEFFFYRPWGIQMYTTTRANPGTWYHVAATRRLISGNLDDTGRYRTSIWVNGVEEAVNEQIQDGNGGTKLNLQSTGINIGRTDSAGFSGNDAYIDELRITLGVARYTTTFIPPTDQFPNQ